MSMCVPPAHYCMTNVAGISSAIFPEPRCKSTGSGFVCNSPPEASRHTSAMTFGMSGSSTFTFSEVGVLSLGVAGSSTFTSGSSSLGVAGSSTFSELLGETETLDRRQYGLGRPSWRWEKDLESFTGGIGRGVAGWEVIRACNIYAFPLSW
jgi:hypothetical protein